MLAPELVNLFDSPKHASNGHSSVYDIARSLGSCTPVGIDQS
jgi:hypothetical protein